MKCYADFTDDVSGEIVGGNYGIAWLEYDGRKQGRTFYPINELEAMHLCENEKNRISEECGQAYELIYPKKDAWVVRMDGI